MPFWKSKPPPPPKPDTLIPESNANIFSRLTFWWAGNLMKLGYKRPLEKDDLYVLNDARLAKNVINDFEKSWEKEYTRKDGKPPSLFRALNHIFGLKFWISGLFRFISDTLQVTSPLILQKILKFAQESWMARNDKEASPTPYKGYLLTVILFIMQMGSTFFINYYFYYSMETGFLIRTALITKIYRKAMMLSGKARSMFTTGKVTNIMSTDTTRLDFSCAFFHVAWAAPVQLCIALGLLINYLGVSALAGFALLVIVGPLQGKVMKTLAKTREKAAKITDDRVKLTQEVLQGIRVIKYYAWEESFLDSLNKLRDKEMQYVRLLLIIRSGITGFAMVIPVFASILTFVVYSVRGGELTADIIFPSLALFSILRLPLILLPMVIATLTDASVSVKRIQELLLAEQLDSLPKVNPDSDSAVKVVDGEFIWESAPPEELSNDKQKRNKKKQRKSKRSSKSENNHVEETKSKKETENMRGNDNNGETSQTSMTLTPIDFTEQMENSSFTPYSHLRYINFSIPRGRLVAVVGSVGSGKSSLLSALVGEMKKVHGEIEFGGSVGYCPQSAWIQNATLRDNIIFGLPFDEEKYRRVVKDCCLEPDLAVLPDGDLTEIGEKGINLSGGQKQRVSVARAVYYNADIVLLDDPLSAVDAHVGNYLITNCIQGSLKGKTRILVTHHLHILPHVDYVICMKDGEIVEQGTYEELMKAGKAFAKLIEEYGEAEEEEEVEETDVKTANKDEIEKEKSKTVEKSSKALMTTEERLTGSVDNDVYFAYVRASGGYILLPLLLFLLIMMQATNIGNNYWLTIWSNGQFGLSSAAYMEIYLAWGIAQGIFSILVGVTFSYAGARSAIALHRNAIKRVMRAPTRFFDTTPLGRIINRFSKDVDTCDNLLSESYRMFFTTLAVVLGTFILISVVFVLFLIPLAPLMLLYYLAAIYYRSTNRELKRLDSVLRSSLYAHFSETLTGLPTIRAYREQDRFLSINEQYIDIENKAYFLTIVVQRWLGIRLESIANILIFFTSLFTVIKRFEVNPAVSGLVLTYALQVTGTFNWCVRQYAEVEANMNAVERLVYYSDSLDIEAAPIIPDHRPPPEWPVKGEVQIKDLVMAYAPELPPVLKGISLNIISGEKIGIVGRTGCGKSTLATSFFRFIEPTSGKIELDGIDITTIGLKDLRSKITIIPQDPVLFNGTLRSNLDPFNEHDDAKLWNALRRSHLIQEDTNDENAEEAITEKSGALFITGERSSPQQNKQEKLTLDSPVNENGNNFSQGQQQLVALARALVRNPKLIIMDEATASVDFRTDYLIQTTIREEFNDSTVLTIAHRLRTVADYDKILVMDAGNIIEYDSPYILMQKPNGSFKGMCERSGEFNELFEISKVKYEKDQKLKKEKIINEKQEVIKQESEIINVEEK